jgi:hypothetical protein
MMDLLIGIAVIVGVAVVVEVILIAYVLLTSDPIEDVLDIFDAEKEEGQ